MADLTAAGALLWLLHALLRSKGWSIAPASSRASSGADFGVDSFAGDVNLHPQADFDVDGVGRVLVRALKVGDALFVHFVASESGKSLRVPLKIADYVKRQAGTQDFDDGKLVAARGWLCNREMLGWRLERNLFGELPAALSTTSAPLVHAKTQDAELSRLSDALVCRIALFLRGAEFARLAQANKSLQELGRDRGLWEAFTRAEFPAAMTRPVDHPKTLYISFWQHRRVQQSRWLQMQPPPEWMRGIPHASRRPFRLPPSLVRPPPGMPNPFSIGEDDDIDDDDDMMRPIFDPRYFQTAM